MSLTPELLLHGYSIGVFPMAEHRDDPEVFWVDPKRRGVIPLNGFRISRSLARRMRHSSFEIHFNRRFPQVVQACADRVETWISKEILGHYNALHEMGHAHSLEVYQDGDLSGGVYGVVLGSAFFGESMFSRRTDASKIALAYLVDRLNMAGFTLFDTQFITDHLASLGGTEITRADYRHLLSQAIEQTADITQPPIPSAYDVIQRNSQMS